MTTLDYHCVKLSPLGPPALLVIATSTTNRNVWAEAYTFMPGGRDDQLVAFRTSSRGEHDETTLAACTLKVALLRLTKSLGADASAALPWKDAVVKSRDDFAQWFWTGTYGGQLLQILYNTECEDLRTDVDSITRLRPIVLTE